MDVPTLMHNLREEVTCSVCIHLYKEPKQLPCLHIFCLECLNGLARTNARHGKIKCPLCQIEVAVPDSGTMETLPDCFYLKNLLDILAIKECNTSKVTCGNCDKKSDEASYCFHCAKFWCKECLNAHSMLRENKEHRVLALKDFEDKDFEDVIKRPAFCSKDFHDRKMLKFYCKLCEVPACKNCVTLEHGKHDVEPLEIIARAVKNNIACKLDTAKETSAKISKCIRELEEKSLLLEHRSRTVKGQIQETVNSLIVSLKQQEQTFIAKVDNETKKSVENEMKKRDKLQHEFEKTEEIIRQFQRLIERSTGAELVRANKAYTNERFQDLPTSEISEMMASLGTSLYTVFLENQALTEIFQNTEIGHLAKTGTELNRCSVEGFQEATAGLETRFEVITRNSKGEQCCCPDDRIAVKVVSAHGGNSAAEMKITGRNDGRYDVSCIPKQIGEHQVLVKINGEDINYVPTIQVKERSYTPVRLIGEGIIENNTLSFPWGITVNDSNEIFVSDSNNDRILVFNEIGEFLSSFGEGRVQWPNGISIDNTGRTYVTNRVGNNVLLFNPDREYVRTVIEKRNNKGVLVEPRGITLDWQGNLIICNTGKKCVQIYSPNGKLVKTIGLGRFVMPFDCLCFEDKIFVSDRDSHIIKVYNKEGKFMYEFGQHGNGDGEMNHPTGLAVDKTGQLLVCSEDNHRVQVFTLDGEFITKFGEYGKEIGQMIRPTSVSVLKSGLIVVCEFENNRLQILA